MEKISVTLTQMNDQFKESSVYRNDADAKEADAKEADAKEADAKEADAKEADAKERTKIVRDKIQFYWNETLSKRLFLETSKQPKNAE